MSLHSIKSTLLLSTLYYLVVIHIHYSSAFLAVVDITSKPSIQISFEIITAAPSTTNARGRTGAVYQIQSFFHSRNQLTYCMMANTNNDDNGEASKKEIDPRIIAATSCIRLPCSCNLAYDTWSDMTRQPSWSKFLKSVKYTDPKSEIETEWSGRILRIPIRWKAETFILDRPNQISWKSISGVPTSGSVDFKQVDASSISSQDNNDIAVDQHCDMNLSMTVQAPRAFARLFRTSYLRDSFFRDKILYGTLLRFRDVVIAEKDNNNDAPKQ